MWPFRMFLDFVEVKNPSHCFTLDMSGAGLALQPLRRAVACMTSMGNPEGNASGGFGMKIGN